MSEPSAVGPVIYKLFNLLSDEEEDKAFHAFFGNNAEHDQDHEEVILFEEWLLFDWRDANNQPLLARGMHEPSFTREQRERCQQLTNNVYSYWQVVDTLPGYSITLEDIYTGKQYRLRHPRYSRELPIDSIFHARLALINDRWSPASGFIEPRVLHFNQNNRSSFFGQRPHELSPRTLLQERRNQAEQRLSGGLDSFPAMSVDEAKQSLQKTLAKAGLDRFVQVETVEKWIRKEKDRTTEQIRDNPYPLALSLLLGLSIGQPQATVQELTTAVIVTQHAIYQQNCSDKKQPKVESNEHFIGTFDPDEWMELFDEAAALIHAGDAAQAAEWFEQAFATMHKSRSTNPLVFRQLHNAALAYFYAGEEVLGRKALAASLALNPRYDLGRQTQASLDTGRLDTVLQLSTILRQTHRSADAGRRRQPMRRYGGRRTSPVIHYYEWLKDLGVTFYDDTPTGQRFAIGSGDNGDIDIPAGPKKPGRNDPCPCGKTKPDGTPLKYKRCHGANI